MQNREPLSFRTVETLFEQLTLAYGHAFLGQWEGIDKATVKEDWRYKLAGLSPEQLAFGLDNLQDPRRPPNAQVFRQWCLAMPAPAGDVPKLPPKRGRVELPPEIRALWRRVHEEGEKATEPQKVRWARGFVATFGEKKGLSSIHLETLEAARKVLRLHESGEAIPDDLMEQGSAAAPAIAPGSAER